MADEKTVQELFSADKLKEFKDICETEYSKDLQLMQTLEGIDQGKLWDVIKTKKPKYQILPDTNLITRTKTGLVASIYTVAKGANFAPTSETDASLIHNVNTFIDVMWARKRVGYYQFLAGNNAALLNIGITQVGWDKNAKDIKLKNIHPLRFRRDPFAEDLQTSAYCYTFEILHKTVIEANALYKNSKELKDFLEDNKDGSPEQSSAYTPTGSVNKSAAKNYYTLTYWFVRDGDKVHEIHTINHQKIIYTKEDIKPSLFPFAILYCDDPGDRLIGRSPCAKILANNIVLNLMDSIAYTAEYKNQRPPKFVTAQSGINLSTFMKHGDEADRTFIVNGIAKDAVQYHQFPAVSPGLQTQLSRLEHNMGSVSGVDDRYTGRDTGSITTTGGTEDMLSRVTLVDAPKIITYEQYTVELSHLVISYYFEWSKVRELYFQNPRTTKWETIEVPLDKIDPKVLLHSYELDISSELPRNKQRLSVVADTMMQAQIQYSQSGQQVEIITPEEWVAMQDLGQAKEMFLERMGAQRMQDAATVAATVIGAYETMLGAGQSPEEAVLGAADVLQQTRNQEVAPDQVQPDPAALLGQTGNIL